MIFCWNICHKLVMLKIQYIFSSYLSLINTKMNTWHYFVSPIYTYIWDYFYKEKFFSILKNLVFIKNEFLKMCKERYRISYIIRLGAIYYSSIFYRFSIILSFYFVFFSNIEIYLVYCSIYVSEKSRKRYIKSNDTIIFQIRYRNIVDWIHSLECLI